MPDRSESAAASPTETSLGLLQSSGAATEGQPQPGAPARQARLQVAPVLAPGLVRLVRGQLGKGYRRLNQGLQRRCEGPLAKR